MGMDDQTVTPMAVAGDEVLTAQLLRAISVFRWATLVWAVIGMALSFDELLRPGLAIGLLVVALVFTSFMTVLAVGEPDRLSDGRLLGVELALGCALLLGDGVVYESVRSVSLPWAWPAAGIIVAGVAFGKRAGLLAAVLIGANSMFAELVLLDRSAVVSSFSKIGLWLLVGFLAGAVTERLRRAEREISIARTREEVARELHDGVLQTLAVIQRRAGDPDLSTMARDQERSLRRYLADARVVSPQEVSGEVGFAVALRSVASERETMHQIDVQVIVTTDCPDEAVPQAVVRAVVGAVGEAITNAAKHGGASKVVVFAEPVEDSAREHALFVSVKDDGEGFNVETMVEGVGVRRSIRGRIEDAGGTVKLKSRVGRGTEVQLWL